MGTLWLHHYSTKSLDKIQHDKDPNAIVLEETEWEIIFQDVEISSELQRRAIKLALKAVGEDKISKLFNKSIKVVIII